MDTSITSNHSEFDLKEEIQNVVPDLPNETLEDLITTLQEAGVRNKHQLRHIYESDMTDAVNKITARTLMEAWKGKNLYYTSVQAI